MSLSVIIQIFLMNPLCMLHFMSLEKIPWLKYSKVPSRIGKNSACLVRESEESYGLLRFHQAVFKNKFPFGTVWLSDKDVPLTVELILSMGMRIPPAFL